MRIWNESCSPILNWKKKSKVKSGSRPRRRATLPGAHSAIRRSSGNRRTRPGVGPVWKDWVRIFAALFDNWGGRNLPVSVGQAGKKSSASGRGQNHNEGTSDLQYSVEATHPAASAGMESLLGYSRITGHH